MTEPQYYIEVLSGLQQMLVTEIKGYYINQMCRRHSTSEMHDQGLPLRIIIPGTKLGYLRMMYQLELDLSQAK